MNSGNPMASGFRPMADFEAKHFRFSVTGEGERRIAHVTLNRPERKNPLTFDSYAELRNLFRDFVYATDIKAVIISGEGGNL